MISINSANFGFLKADSPQLVRLGALAEHYFQDDPNTCQRGHTSGRSGRDARQSDLGGAVLGRLASHQTVAILAVLLLAADDF